MPTKPYRREAPTIAPTDDRAALDAARAVEERAAQQQLWVAARLPAHLASSVMANRLSRAGLTPISSDGLTLLAMLAGQVESLVIVLETFVRGSDAGGVSLAVVSSEATPDLDQIEAHLEPAARALARLKAHWLVPALTDSRIAVHLQPVFDARGEVFGQEALARALDRQGDVVEGRAIFAAARDLNLEAFVDRVFRMESIRAFCRPSPRRGALFVNFDADVAPDDLPSAAADLVDACKLPRIRVIFEATHPERCANPERIGSQFAALRAAGFQVALDDVGERHSSAPLLRTTSPDFVILDGKLLRSAAESSYAREIVADIVASAGRVGARVIAKGIETTDHLAVAQAEGADLFMGYLMGRPRPGGSE